LEAFCRAQPQISTEISNILRDVERGVQFWSTLIKYLFPLRRKLWPISSASKTQDPMAGATVSIAIVQLMEYVAAVIEHIQIIIQCNGFLGAMDYI
jgi:hypothetical protein